MQKFKIVIQDYGTAYMEVGDEVYYARTDHKEDLLEYCEEVFEAFKNRIKQLKLQD